MMLVFFCTSDVVLFRRRICSPPSWLLFSTRVSSAFNLDTLIFTVDAEFHGTWPFLGSPDIEELAAGRHFLEMSIRNFLQRWWD